MQGLQMLSCKWFRIAYQWLMHCLAGSPCHTWRGAVGVTGSRWTGSAFFVKGLTLTMLLLCYTVQLTFTNTCPNINICQNMNIWWDSEVIVAPFCFLWKHLVLINSHFISINGNLPSKSYAPENKQTNKNYLRQ